MKEIIIVTFSLSNNGAERVFSELANEWNRKGHKVKVIEFEKNAYGGEDSFELKDGIQLITLSKKHIKNKIHRYAAYFKDLIKHFKQSPNAVVIAFSFTTQAMVGMASLFCRNKMVFSERNDPNQCPYTKLHRWLRTRFFSCADRCVFQTQDAASYFPKKIQERGCIIVNPINPALPEKYIGERRKTAITASRLRPQKNLTLLINAFDLFHHDHPDYTLEIYGMGEEQEMLENLIAQNGLTDSVFLKGFAKNVNEVMNDCAMYVCSSDYEGISNAMLEAIGMGVPTVSTDCPIGGARQVIENGVNGLLVPIGDVNALYLAMKEIAEDKMKARQLSENGYKIRELYSVDRISELWLDLF